MTGAEAAPLAAKALAGAVAGLALGLVHFASLWWNTRLDGQASALRMVAVQLLRLLVLAAGLTGMAMVGAACLLGGAAGVLLARRIVMRRVAPAGER